MSSSFRNFLPPELVMHEERIKRISTALTDFQQKNLGEIKDFLLLNQHNLNPEYHYLLCRLLSMTGELNALSFSISQPFGLGSSVYAILCGILAKDKDIIQALDELKEKALNQKDWLVVLDILYYKADKSERLKKNDQALVYLNELKQIVTDHPDSLGFTNIMLVAESLRGWILLDKNEMHESKSILQQAISQAEGLNDKYATIMLLNVLASTEKMLGDLRESRDVLLRALTSANEFQRNRSAILNNLGEIERLCGNFDAALTYYNESLALKLKYQDIRGVIVTYNNLAELEKSMGNFSAAIVHLKQSKAINRDQVKDLFIDIVLTVNIAHIYLLQGNVDNSISDCLMAIEMIRKENTTQMFLQEVGIILAQAYWQKNDTEKVLEIINKYFTARTQGQNLISGLLLEVNLLVKSKKILEAKQKLFDILKLAKERGSNEEILLCRAHKAKLEENSEELQSIIDEALRMKSFTIVSFAYISSIELLLKKQTPEEQIAKYMTLLLEYTKDCGVVVALLEVQLLEMQFKVYNLPRVTEKEIIITDLTKELNKILNFTHENNDNYHYDKANKIRRQLEAQLLYGAFKDESSLKDHQSTITMTEMCVYLQDTLSYLQSYR